MSLNLEQHLDAHMYVDTYDGWESCECGWREEQERRSESGSIFTHAAHVAATWREARTWTIRSDLDSADPDTVVQCMCEGKPVVLAINEMCCSGCYYPPYLVVWTPEDGVL